jgi:hypothetical protein
MLGNFERRQNHKKINWLEKTSRANVIVGDPDPHPDQEDLCVFGHPDPRIRIRTQRTKMSRIPNTG